MDNMACCDGWVTIKAFELIFSVFCIIFKRVTDDEANKLFYFLQKVSREWPLLNNVTWEENGAIFTDVAYGGYVIITTGLIIAHCTGELQYCKRTENFFLTLGALLFIAAGSLELAALDSVEERLVDNAAILGVISLLTGLLFILDLLLASKRRKKVKTKTVKKLGSDKLTQTETTKVVDIYRSSDMNGNVQNGGQQITNGDVQYNGFPKMGSQKIPKNAVKILPTSPLMEENFRLPVTNSNNEYVGTIANPLSPPLYEPRELKTNEAKIRSTESFLKSEKGEFAAREKSINKIFIPTGYVLVPTEQTKHASGSDRSTPPGYAKIITDNKVNNDKVSPGYVMIPIDQVQDGKVAARKLQSPTVSTTVKTPQGYYYAEADGRMTPYGQSPLQVSRGSLSDGESDDAKPESYLYARNKYSSEHSHKKKHNIPDSIKADSRLDQDLKWKGKVNRGYDRDEPDLATTPFQRSTSRRSLRMASPEKPKSILGTSPYRKENDFHFPSNFHYDSLDSQKIAEDLRQLKDITKSEHELARDLEIENQMLKEHLKKEKEEKEKLKKNLGKTWDELEDEKDRRVSEREEQYFGINDLTQSHKLKNAAAHAKVSEEHFKSKDEKAKEDQEFRKVIDEGFYFLNEQDKRKQKKRPPNLSKAEDAQLRVKTLESLHWNEDSDEVATTDEESRGATPASASYKSEAQFRIGSPEVQQSDKMSSSTPTSPRDPGYVLHTAHNWPESGTSTPGPTSAKKTQRFMFDSPPKSPSPEADDQERHKTRQEERLPENPDKIQGRRRGLLLRKVDFPEEPVTEIQRPATVMGSTSTWKKWLQPKPKLQPTKSYPN